MAECPDCATRSTYSLGCLDCCRRLYASSASNHRAAMLAHVLKWSPIAVEIKSLIRTNKKRTGSGTTSD